jgi:arsenate reductase (glutaredoxin)
MKLYGISNCDTVKKARAWLEANGVQAEFHDFKKRGVSDAMLKGWLQQVPWGDLINRKGTTWRKLSDEDKAKVKGDASAIALMLEKPSVIKRPIMEKNGKVLQLGFDEEKYRSLFGK